MTFFSPIFPLTITCYPMSSCNECIVFLFIHFGFLILSLNLCLIVGFVSVGRRSKLHLPALRTFWKILPFPMFYNISFCLSFPLQGFYTVRDNNWFFLNLLKSLATIPLILSSTFSRWKKATLKNAGLGLFFFFISEKREKDTSILIPLPVLAVCPSILTAHHNIITNGCQDTVSFILNQYPFFKHFKKHV